MYKVQAESLSWFQLEKWPEQCAPTLFSEMVLVCCCIMNYIKTRQRLKTRIKSNIKGYPCSFQLHGSMRSISIHLKAPSWKTKKERPLRDSLLLHIPACCGQIMVSRNQPTKAPVWLSSVDTHCGSDWTAASPTRLSCRLTSLLQPGSKT